MTTLITDRHLERSLIRRRRMRGADRFDEVWEGVYVMNAYPNLEHQDLVGRLTYLLQYLIVDPGLGRVQPGCNISDRPLKWKENYRCPDVAVFLKETKAISKRTHWLGGPDLAIEIISPNDRSREKLEFYAKAGTRELLLLDRDPWSLELYRFENGLPELVQRADVANGGVVETNVVPLLWRLVAGTERPLLEVSMKDGSKRWET